ncbi:MAG: FG-GAP repeat domain-containing protein [Kofleriaceae bacterium]
MTLRRFHVLAWASIALASCAVGTIPPPPSAESLGELGALAPGWTGELVALVHQSYVGWDVEIGDADGDGRPEILTGSAPDGRVYRFDRRDHGWSERILADQMAGLGPGMVLGTRIVDLDGDGVPEILAGTGEEDGDVAQLRILRDDGQQVTTLAAVRAKENTSSYTHGLATADLDGDGVLEIVSAYCGNGEVIRYDATPGMTELRARKVLQLSGSGEDAWLVDVDGDGQVELVVSNGFRDGAARVQIHDLDPATGDPRRTPRLVLDGFEGKRAFYASIAVGDVDSDGRPELLVAWKQHQSVNRTSLVAYRIHGITAKVAHVLVRDDPELDLGYFEKMIAFDDLDGDGRNEVYLSTRGDGISEGISSHHLGRVYRFDVRADGTVARQTVFDFDPEMAESAWLAAGDADGDGARELVIATGKGDRTLPGWSWVVALRKAPPIELTSPK